jgi:predicted transcriptional regulator
MQHYNPSRLRIRRAVHAALVLAVLATAGCTPLSEKEKEYLETRKAEKDESENFSRRMESSEQYNDIIQKIQKSPVEGTTLAENWVRLRLTQTGEQVIFQKWTASQKTTDNYEVRFLYTILSKAYEAKKHGFLWSFDKTLDRITGPIELKPEELEPTYKKRGKSQVEIKREQNRWSLE